MKALDEYILMVLFTFLLKEVPCILFDKHSLAVSLDRGTVEGPRQLWPDCGLHALLYTEWLHLTSPIDTLNISSLLLV